MIAQKIAGFIAPMGVVLVAEACSSSPTTTPTSNLVEPSGETPSFLFVAQGTSGTLEAIEGCPDTFLLTIDGPGPGVTVFSDRPSRLAFNIPVSEFVDNWAVYGFVEEPAQCSSGVGGSRARHRCNDRRARKPGVDRRNGDADLRCDSHRGLIQLPQGLASIPLAPMTDCREALGTLACLSIVPLRVPVPGLVWPVPILQPPTSPMPI